MGLLVLFAFSVWFFGGREKSAAWRKSRERPDREKNILPEVVEDGERARNHRVGSRRPRLLQKEEVERLLRTTWLRAEDLDFPEETVPERIESLNRAMQRAGIREDQVKILVENPADFDSGVFPMRCQEGRYESGTVLETWDAIFGGGRVSYFIKGGNLVVVHVGSRLTIVPDLSGSEPEDDDLSE